MSVARALRVIDHLAQSGPTSLRSLARALELPLGSAHRLLAVLEHEGVAARDGDDEWRLGYRLLGIAGSQLQRLELPTAARPDLERLSALTGQTAFLAVRSGAEVVYLDKVQTDADVQLYVELGARRPVHGTALGKAMLAFTAAQVRDAVLDTPLARVTQHTITDPAVLRDQLATVRTRRYATDKDEAGVGICCLAAPILDHLGYATGAISIAGTDPGLRAEAPEFVAAVIHAAERVSRQLGSSDGTDPKERED